MNSDAFGRFRRSMKIGYQEWHERIGLLREPGDQRRRLFLHRWDGVAVLTERRF